MNDLFSLAGVPLSDHQEDELGGTHLQFGGIYRYKGETEIYDGALAINFLSNAFYFIFDGINHIEAEVEIASAHTMERFGGYGLRIKKVPVIVSTRLRKTKKERRKRIYSGRFNRWEIVDSGIVKSNPDHMIQSGRCGPYFHESLKPFLKMIHQ